MKYRERPRREAMIFARRSVVVGLLFSLCIMGLIFQIWRLQNVYGDVYERYAAMQRARRDISRTAEVFQPVRGGFVDRHNQPITGTEQVFTVTLDVYALHRRHVRQSTHDNDIRQGIFDEISGVLNISRWDLAEMFVTDHETGNLRMTTGRYRRPLQHNVPAEIAIPLSESVPEINLEQTSLRWYPDPFFAPQVIGFTRGDVPWGLEAFYRNELAGEQGRRILVQGEAEIVPVRDGYTIVTTLDSEIQRLAQYYVDRTHRRHPSQFVGMIVMDPFTSEVLAMAQAPTFSMEDPFNSDYFTCPHILEIWDYLDYGQRTTEVMSLWRNYHTTRSNEPGSTFKPFVIAAAIEEGVISRYNRFHCEGRREIADQVVWCHNEWGCGPLSLRSALARSCNMAMVDINRTLGQTLFYRYRGEFGFGERTGIDLPGEEAVSSHYVMYPFHRLGPVEMATSSMGQGFNATTMQIINGYAALINGGNLRRPFLVSQIIDSQGNIVHETEPTIVRRVISPETSFFIRNEMRYVVSMRPNIGDFTGTGWRSYIPGHAIGGKTGTAQQGIRGGGEYIPTFVTFFPVDNPQFLVLLTIDRVEDTNYRFAGSTVAPIMREFLLDLIQLRNIRATVDTDSPAAELAGTPMPNFENRRLLEAVRDLVNMEIGYQVVGGGTVISHHWPAPGHPIPENSPIIFYTDPETRTPELMVTVPDIEGLPAETARFLMDEARLTGVVFRNRADTGNNAESMPHTSRAEPLPYYHITAAPAPVPYIVHQQFPAAGSEVEHGTQIIIRAR
ncbi:MAG: penicillin-binding transpeptidase domain-containing protein [Defluviitaleaceae bacterium]|nr:penicillin-binding transpeptidase domain-containing protein [Defluviitaleaceae bacterium]MCL2263200.1 penicillin-binding transpeptidase domain-containing protein [Defluviitaleaceae bacterium]